MKPARITVRMLGIAALIAVIGTSGCMLNALALPYYMFAANRNAKPPIKLCKKKREHKRVMILSTTDNGLRFGFDAVDEDLTSALGALISAGDKRIEVVSDREVRQWQDENPDWDEKPVQDIGEKFDVDYVIEMEVTKFTLNESKNQYLLQGSTNITMKVHDIDGEKILDEQLYNRDFPPNRTVPLTDVASEEQFRKMFLARVATELSWFFVPHCIDDEFSKDF